MKIEENKRLDQLCTFGIGGPARYFIEVTTINQMQAAFLFCKTKQLPLFILGKGSNSLFDDRGFNGVVILNKINFLEKPTEGKFHVGAGYSFSLLGTQTARDGWTGLEFASGIPGSVGGAVFMNAGANGCETCNSLVSIDFMDLDGNITTYRKEELDFSYRHSSFQKMKGAITGATFLLTPSEEARKKQIEIITKRKNSQPLKEMSAGCIFRNPATLGAGALIDQQGLKGLSIGGAKISEIHANFIVNTGAASSQDVMKLIALIKEKIQSETGIPLESEVRCIPFEMEL